MPALWHVLGTSDQLLHLLRAGSKAICKLLSITSLVPSSARFREKLWWAQVSVQSPPCNFYLVACLLVCYKISWLGGVLGEQHPLTFPRLLFAPALQQPSRNHALNCRNRLLAAHIELLQGIVYTWNICSPKVIVLFLYLASPFLSKRGENCSLHFTEGEKGQKVVKGCFSKRCTGAHRSI